MKKLIVAVAAILLVAFNANAQLGVIAGVTSNSTDLESAYSDIAKTQSVTQYHAGLVFKMNLPIGLYLQPGVIYNMKGATLSEQIASQKVNIDTKTGFLEVPVQAGFSLDFGGLAAFAFVEPYVGYAITTETKAEAENATSQALVEAAASALGVQLNTTDEDANKWDGRERLQYGVGVGGGVLLFDRIAVSAKYYWDMGNLYNSDGQSSLSAQEMYNATKTKTCSGIIASLTLYF